MPLILKPEMNRKIILVASMLIFTALILISGISPTASAGSGTDDANSVDKLMSGIILSGVFIIVGGIMAVIVRRDISKRNMNISRWTAVLIVLIIIVPIAETSAILNSNVNSFYGSVSLASSYLLFFGLYLYFRGKSHLLVKHVPTELVVKLGSAYKEIVAFGILILGLLLALIGLYQVYYDDGSIGKPIIMIGCASLTIGAVLIKMWFSFDQILINTREIRIKRGSKVEKVAWKDVESIMFYKELSHLLNIELGKYQRKLGKAGSQKVVEVITEGKRLKFMDGEIPSYEDFRILFFILLHHRETSNPETKVYFHSKWAKSWYRDYRRHIMQNSQRD